MPDLKDEGSFLMEVTGLEAEVVHASDGVLVAAGDHPVAPCSMHDFAGLISDLHAETPDAAFGRLPVSDGGERDGAHGMINGRANEAAIDGLRDARVTEVDNEVAGGGGNSHAGVLSSINAVTTRGSRAYVLIGAKRPIRATGNRQTWARRQAYDKQRETYTNWGDPESVARREARIAEAQR